LSILLPAAGRGESPEGPADIGQRRPVSSPLRRHVNLTRELAITQFKLRYTGSALGYVWSLVNPLALFGTMYLVFVVLFHANNASPNFAMQLLLGIVLWTFFSETTNVGIIAIASNAHMLRKAYFPRSILVIASSVTALMTFVINFVLVLILATLLQQADLRWASLLAPVYFIELYALILGVALLLSALYVFYRDLGHIWGIFSQVLFYGSGVVFPIAIVHTPGLRTLLMINPVAQIIEDLRNLLISSDPRVASAESVLGAAAPVPYLIVIGVFILGAVAFRRLTPRFAESL
jgi:ABC-2 type transport system permease protein